MRRRRVRSALAFLFAASAGAGLADGCSAVSNGGTMGTGGTGGTGATTSGSAGHTTSSSTGTGGAGGMMIITFPDAGDDADTSDAGDGGNVCGTECGPTELCDPAHLGYDDNCNGLVDETCTCTPGQAHWCFAGDPKYYGTPGCFPGTEICNELGRWGPCVGGVQAIPPNPCYVNNPDCHAITGSPGVTVDLSTGLGGFGQNAVPGSETYTVMCPTGVNPCPGVTAGDMFSSVQSGEYEVTYTKMVAGDDAGALSCTFPLIVGAPGLRVELTWEHYITGGTPGACATCAGGSQDMGVDLDLHVHQPINTDPWGISPGVPQDCTWSTCRYYDFEPPPQNSFSPLWFANPPAMPPTPVNWHLFPTMDQNTCYYDPAGIGLDWQQGGMGCHNPRLDCDDITCDDSITDPNNPDFCVPENVNVDFPPSNQWFRVGVDYYNNHGLTYDVHPEIKIYCDGALSADLGPNGFYMPQAPVTFAAADGEQIGGSGNRFWLVADVEFISDGCGSATCQVKPLYSDPTQQTPFLAIDSAVTQTWAPPWP